MYSGKPGLGSPSTLYHLWLKADVPLCSPCRSRMSPLQNRLWQLTAPQKLCDLLSLHIGVACALGPSFALSSAYSVVLSFLFFSLICHYTRNKYIFLLKCK